MINIRKNIKVKQETPRGLNQTFYNPNKNKTMSRGEFVKEIEKGKYPAYHIMHTNKNGVTQKISRSNPDRSSGFL